jgi:hypothetical protein
MNARKAALAAIDAVQLPAGWSPIEAFRGEWERHAFLWAPETGPGLGTMPLSGVHIQALGAGKAGGILVRSGGCEIYATASSVQAAVNHAIAWGIMCRSSVPGPSAGVDQLCDLLDQARDIVCEYAPGHTVWLDAVNAALGVDAVSQ